MTARSQLRTQIASIARKNILYCSSASNWRLGRGSRIIVEAISWNNVALLVPKAVMGTRRKGSERQAEGMFPPHSCGAKELQKKQLLWITKKGQFMSSIIFSDFVYLACVLFVLLRQVLSHIAQTGPKLTMWLRLASNSGTASMTKVLGLQRCAVTPS